MTKEPLRRVPGWMNIAHGALVIEALLAMPGTAAEQYPPPGSASAAEVFDALAERAFHRHAGPTNVSSSPPDVEHSLALFATAQGRAFLLAEVSRNAPQKRGQSAKHALAEGDRAPIRQQIALHLLAGQSPPSDGEIAEVATLWNEQRVWEPSHAAEFLATSGDPKFFDAISAELEVRPDGEAGARAARALGILGHAPAAEVLEAFLRNRFGTREYNTAKEALMMLGRKGPVQRAAVCRAALSLISHHPGGVVVEGSATIQLDHPDRVSYLQGTGLDILREVGSAAEADELDAALRKLGNLPDGLAEFAKETVKLLRARAGPQPASHPSL